MRAISIFLTLLLLVAWIALARYAYVCQILDQCDPTENVDGNDEALSSNRPKTLSLKYNNTVILEDYEEFDFSMNAVSSNLSENNEQFLKDLATYLNNNPERKMEIYGSYRNSEAGKTFGVFENIGLARANEIRAALVNLGVDENRISLNYEKLSGDEMGRPIRFKLFDNEKQPEEFDRVMYTFKNMTFTNANFAIDSDNFKPSDQFLIYADSVQAFLKNNPKHRVFIIGHTDNSGNEGYNEVLGQKRASSAKRYLQKMGIKNKIITSSKGESQPMAPNNTDANKQKNRRVNFLLKK